MNEQNKEVVKALRQIEIIKRFGHRPDVWIYEKDSPKVVWPANKPNEKISSDEIEKIADVMDMTTVYLIPDNGRDNPNDNDTLQ